MKRRPSDVSQTGYMSANTQTTHEETTNASSKLLSTGLRKFLGRVGGATAMTIAAGMTGQTALAQLPTGNDDADQVRRNEDRYLSNHNLTRWCLSGVGLPSRNFYNQQ